MIQVDYIIGLDLGQSKDYSALAIAQRTCTPGHTETDPINTHYVIRHIHRWPLHTMFTKVAKEVCTLAETPPLKLPLIAIDKTGVGAGPVEMIQEARPHAILHPILITAGHAVTHDGLAWHVPKKELVSTMLTLAQSDRLRIADIRVTEGVAVGREDLIRELQNFRIKITTAKNETFEAWREGQHDDLVLSTAMCTWLGEHVRPYNPIMPDEYDKPQGHRAMDRLMSRESRADMRGLYGRKARR